MDLLTTASTSQTFELKVGFGPLWILVSFRLPCVSLTRRVTFFGSLGYCATTR
jgi:hypothetical protein